MKGGENLKLNPFGDSENLGELHCLHCGQFLPSKEPICLRECQRIDGILQSLTPLDENFVLVNISGFMVELPRKLETKLKPLMGQPMRVAVYFGKYHAAKLTRRPAR